MILFENKLSKNILQAGLLFADPIKEVLCTDQRQIMSCLAEIDALRCEEYYLAGCISYEAAYHLLNLSMPWQKANLPFIHFFAFKKPQYLSTQAVNKYLGNETTSLFNLALDITRDEYQEMFSKVYAHLKAGNTYQVNLTTKYRFGYEGSEEALYKALSARQRVAYSALMKMPGYSILSLSPELFFAKHGNRLYAKPMKGTMPRGENEECDVINREFLKLDAKSQSENTMIVDLLRNDLARISKPGSVCVSSLMDVETYETVHQMTSSIESEVGADITFLSLIQALFPCGSITGAPKKRTMELIAEIEKGPRGVYTGAIGYITPENNMCFNVPIRTLYLDGTRGEMGVGGAVLYDSDVASEFTEIEVKARFLSGLNQGT